MELADLIDPKTTAVMVSEMQRGIAGDLVPDSLAMLSNAVTETNLIPNLARLLDGARAAGTRVIHTTMQLRADRAGIRIVSPLMAVTMKDPHHLLVGSPDAEIIPELGPAETDIVDARIHGMSAFSGTELDAILRSLDIRTLIIGGVSLNEAIMGASIEAVNLGYRVVIPRDAALGLPKQFAEDMLKYAYSLLAMITTTEEILDVWTKWPTASVPSGVAS